MAGRRAGFCCALALILACRASAADGVDRKPAATYPKPYSVLLRSLAFPGWGQLENQQAWKAALVMTAEGGFLASGFVEIRRADRAFENHVAANQAGDQGEADRQFQIYEDRRSRAIARFWWAGFAMLISMLDAYVDAHLRDFADVEPIRISTPGSAREAQEPEFALALAWRF